MKHTSLGERIKGQREFLRISQEQLADLAGVRQSTVSGWESGTISSMRNWKKVADVLHIPHDELRRLMGEATLTSGKTTRIPSAVRENVRKIIEDTSTPISVVEATVAGARDVPVLGRAIGGDDGRFIFNGEILGWELRPPMLAGVKEAYAVYADGDSMYPRYKPGETVWINPNRPPARGEDVVVQLHPEDEFEPPYGFIKEFVGWEPSRLVVRQYNPSGEVYYDRDRVITIHPVVFAQR